MLTVPTFLAPVEGKGIGLFAAKPIACGQTWWVYDDSFDRIISADAISRCGDLQREFLQMYATLEPDGSRYLCVDNARFVNHSSSPNTREVVKEGVVVAGVAIRAIAQGEEITCNYRLICEECKQELGFVEA